LRLLSELTWHTGNTTWQEGKNMHGNTIKIAMPDFYTMSTNTNVTCISGQYLMVAALSPKNAEGKLDPERKVMVFVKCDVLPVVP
jgi:Flp pilus assembly secretin CpaC